MLNHRIERADWGASFDRLTASHTDIPGQATARLKISRPAGDASRDDITHDRSWLPFVRVRWEPRRETITVALDGLDHRIEAPLVVWADNAPGGPVRRLLILGADRRRDEVAFKMTGLHS